MQDALLKAMIEREIALSEYHDAILSGNTQKINRTNQAARGATLKALREELKCKREVGNHAA